jgi:hypothetical protein
MTAGVVHLDPLARELAAKDVTFRGIARRSVEGQPVLAHECLGVFESLGGVSETQQQGGQDGGLGLPTNQQQ